MVVHGIALPKVSGSSRSQELAIVPAEAAAIPVDDVRGGRFLSAVLVPLLLMIQATWLTLLGYGALRFLI
jgi:hypothetical protein